MGPEGIFSHTISLLERSLDLRSNKHDAIVSNVANIDTPNYRAFDVMVEDELKKLGPSSGFDGRVRMEVTRAGHMEPQKNSTHRTTIRTDSRSGIQLQRPDGNTVDLDREMAAMAENSLMYTLSAQIIAKKFQGIRNMIEGGNK